MTGVVAILLGCVALSRVQAGKQGGGILSTVAILLGLADVVGWVILLSWSHSTDAVPMNLADLKADPEALEGMPPHLNGPCVPPSCSKSVEVPSARAVF